MHRLAYVQRTALVTVFERRGVDAQAALSVEYRGGRLNRPPMANSKRPALRFATSGYI